MVAEFYYFAFDASDNLVLVLLVLSMLKHMLDNIVAKLIFGECMDF